MSNLRILLSDDHKIIRDGLKALLENEEAFQIAGEASNGLEALDICRKKQVDFIIMDIHMPEMNGIEATRKINEEFPEIRILALTMMAEERHIREMIQAGASGYISKNSDREELVEAIGTISDGGHYFSDEAMQKILMDLFKEGTPEKEQDPANLTERELEVLALIVDEYTNPEIADKLYISVRTVDAHRRNLLQKTGARNTAGLVSYAHKHNLVEPD